VKLSAAQLASLSNLYIGYYNRAPDAVGLNYWAGRLDAGMSLKDIAQSFSVQTESTTQYPYLQNPYSASVSTFLTSVYANLFNRVPDTAGLTYWTNEINSGRSNVGNAIINIISGAAAGSTDAMTLSNKSQVGLAFATALGNIPGGVYGLGEQAFAKQIDGGVSSDQATVTAALKSISDFFANGGGKQPVVPTSVTLTVGTDNVSGSALNPISVSGTAGVSTTGAQPTFTAGDKIVGDASVNNSLNITDQTTGGTWAPTTLGGVTISNMQNVTFSSGEAVTANTTAAGGTQGYSNLKSLGVYGSGGLTITTGNGVAVTAIDSAATTNNESVLGGSDVSLTANGITTGGRITVGSSTAAPQGNVTVNTSQRSSANGTSDAITIVGGQTVTVSQTLAAGDTNTTAATYFTNTGGAVTVTGQLAANATGATATNSNPTGTTSVSVTQSKTTAATWTVNLSSATAAAGAAGASTIATITDGTTTLTLTNTGIVAAGGQVFSAAQIAQAIYAATQSSAATGNNLFGGSSGISYAWSNGAGALTQAAGIAAFKYTVGAPASGSPLLTFSGVTSSGAVLTVPPTINNAAAASIATTVAATGGIYDNTVSISDANGSSATAASTISTVTLNGLNFDTNTIGTVINSSALQNLNISNAASGSKVTINNNLVGSTNTTLNLTLNAASLGANLIDTNSEITTLNITTNGSGSSGASSLSGISGTFGNVTTITVKGTGGINLGSLSALSKLSSFSTSGGAAVNANLSGNTAFLTSITATGTGMQALTIDPRTQSFNGTGSSGMDIITIGNAAVSSVTAGSAANNILVWNAAAPSTFGNVTGFNTLYVGSGSSGGNFNMSTLGSAYTNLGVSGGATTTGVTFSNVNPGTSLAIDAPVGAASPSAGTATVVYQTTGSTGGSNSLNLTLGVSASDARASASIGVVSATRFGNTMVGSLNLLDQATLQTGTNGVGTLNIASFDSAIAQANTITTLVDSGLSKLNISGTGAVVISSLTDSATSLAIVNNSTSTAYSTITALTDHNLSSLSFSGNGYTGAASASFPVAASSFALTDANATLTISNTGVNPVSLSVTGSSSAGNGPGISTLSLAGSAGITLSTLTLDGTLEAITSTSSTPVTISALADTNLTNLTIGGSGNMTFTTINGSATKTVIDSSSGNVTIAADTAADTSLTLMNTGSGTFTYAAGTKAALATISLVGNVIFSVIGDVALASLNGTADNANVTVGLGVSTTDATITLGNGNNVITTASTANQLTANLGTGSNSVTISGNIATGKVDTITFGAHTGGADTVIVAGGMVDYATVAQIALGTTTTNTLVAGDTITFTAAQTAGANVTTIAQFSGNPTSTLGATITAAIGSITTQYGAASFTYGGNTYVVDNLTALAAAPAAGGATAEVIKIMGVHQISNLVNGTITLLT